MRIEELPTGNAKSPVPLQHFPTVHQAVIWRNWNLVPCSTIASVLHCTEAECEESAAAMGLPPAREVSGDWLKYGYLTIIRNNWHLLNYQQLLQLIGWTPDQLALSLKCEDFFWEKLGSQKPICPPVYYRKLTSDEEEATRRLRQDLASYFTEQELEGDTATAKPFDFRQTFPSYGDRQVCRKEKRFPFNFLHSYMASCGDILLDIDSCDPMPESLLALYQELGIEGTWLHVTLYLLYPISGAEEYSANHEIRLANLKRLASRCAKYGIGLYLYLNEPRFLPYSFYETHEDWAGAIVQENYKRANCITRSSAVLNYLSDTLEKLYSEVPGLSGALTIAMSENITHCNSFWTKAKCPYCKDRDGADMVAEIINTMESAIHRASPNAHVMTMSWGWMEDLEYNEQRNHDFAYRILGKLNKEVEVVCVSEHGVKTMAGGVENHVEDYSIGWIGPGEQALEMWTWLKEHGRKAIAKIQLNNSWELSAVPYVPIPHLYEEHLKRIEALKLDGVMFGWTLGGYPGGGHLFLKQSVQEWLDDVFGQEAGAALEPCLKRFAEIYHQYPYDVMTCFLSPVNFGPRNLLHLKPTGYSATMIGFAYDDMEHWRGIYPADVSASEFVSMADQWETATRNFERLSSCIPEKGRAVFDELLRMAQVVLCHFRSTAIQMQFVLKRETESCAVLSELLRQEAENAHRLHSLIRQDARIGFEASNHYYYTANDLAEKVLNCAWLQRQLSKTESN